MRHEESRPGGRAAISESVRAGQVDRTSPVRQISEPLTLDHAIAEAERAAEEGMTRARYGEDVRIVAAIETEVRRLAAEGREFTPDEILPQMESRRAVGSVFSRLAREGDIRCVGATTSTRPSRHGALTRRWVGSGVRHG